MGLVAQATGGRALVHEKCYMGLWRATGIIVGDRDSAATGSKPDEFRNDIEDIFLFHGRTAVRIGGL